MVHAGPHDVVQSRCGGIQADMAPGELVGRRRSRLYTEVGRLVEI